MSNPINLLRFGDFSLDLRQRILLHQGAHVPLTPKAFEILLYLVENRDYIVSKEELMTQVWGEIVVEEGNIAKNISLLRKTLANGNGKNAQDKPSGENDQYIATFSKLGYRFVYPVEEIAVNPPKPIRQLTVVPATARETQNDSLPSPTVLAEIVDVSGDESTRLILGAPLKRKFSNLRVRSWWLGLTAAGMAGLLVLTGWAWFRKDSDELPVIPSNHRMIASWKDSVGPDLLKASISPDGNYIAFSKSNTSAADIFVQQLVGQKTINITSDHWPDYSPVWSPNGQMLAFLSKRENRNEIWITPLLGGTGKFVYGFDGESAPVQLLKWSNDGNRIYYCLSRNLFALDLQSGQITKLTDFGETTPNKFDFSISHDEKQIAYCQKTDGSVRIFMASLKGDSPKQLTRDGEENRNPIWFADGKRILYKSKYGDFYQLFVVRLDDLSPIQLTNSHESSTPLCVPLDGRKIIYVVLREEADIYQLNVATGGEQQLTSNATLEILPEISPNEEAVVFHQVFNEGEVLRSGITTQSTNTEGNIRKQIAEGFDARWSPDSNHLTYLRDNVGQSSLWIIRADGAEPRQLTKPGLFPNGINSTPYNWTQPYNYSWSPRGDRLAFNSRQSGASNIWTVSVKEGVETMISNNTDPKLVLGCPSWSPDANRLVYLAQPSSSNRVSRNIVMQDLGSSVGTGGKSVVGEAQPIYPTDMRVRMLGWSADGKHFLIGLVEPEDRNVTVKMDLMLIDVDHHLARSQGELSGVYFNSPRLSADGKAVVFVSRQDNCDNIWSLTLGDRSPKKLTTNTDPQNHFGGLAWMPKRKGIIYSRQFTTTMIFTIE